MSTASQHEEEVLNLFTQSGALFTGHFVLRSGLHSGHFFQCARIGEDLRIVSRLAEMLIDSLPKLDCKTVLAPAMGGLVIGQEVARQLKKRFIFAEKQEDKLTLRRGFKLESGEKVLIVEDVITQGGRAQESIDIVKNAGGTPIALAILVDRSQDKISFEIPYHSLLQMSFPTYEADNLPEELKNIPVTKPGS